MLDQNKDITAIAKIPQDLAKTNESPCHHESQDKQQVASEFKYELDDGPLTDAQMDAIRQECPDMSDAKITRSIWDVITPPRYEMDDGPLTDEQIATIRRLSSATNTPAKNFTKRLF